MLITFTKFVILYFTNTEKARFQEEQITFDNVKRMYMSHTSDTLEILLFANILLFLLHSRSNIMWVQIKDSRYRYLFQSD